MDGVSTQQTMARFAMHKVRTAVYARMVLAGQLTEAQARDKYAEAMRNFDQLMALAMTEPEHLDACIADMERGFVMPGNGA